MYIRPLAIALLVLTPAGRQAAPRVRSPDDVDFATDQAVRGAICDCVRFYD